MIRVVGKLNESTIERLLCLAHQNFIGEYIKEMEGISTEFNCFLMNFLSTIIEESLE